MADVGKTTLTVLAYVARFPEGQQRAMFEKLNRLGSRGAKRYVECLTRPPTAEQIGRRVARWVSREFPALPIDQVVEGVREALFSLQSMRIGKK
jgi:hypothetical protein